MLIILGRIKGKTDNPSDSLYIGLALGKSATNSSKGSIDYYIDNKIPYKMLSDRLSLKKTVFDEYYHSVKGIEYWGNVYNCWASDDLDETSSEDTDSAKNNKKLNKQERMESVKSIPLKELHFGRPLGTDKPILEFDGNGNLITELEAYNLALIAYTNMSNEILSYLVVSYNPEAKKFKLSRKLPSKILEEISEDTKYANLIIKYNDVSGEPELYQEGFPIMHELDTSRAAKLEKYATGDKVAAATTVKTTGIKKNISIKSQLDEYNESVIDALAQDGGLLSKEVKDFLKDYYAWYFKTTFELLLGSTKYNVSTSQLSSLDALKSEANSSNNENMKSFSNLMHSTNKWHYVKTIKSNSGALRCYDPSCNAPLKIALVFEPDGSKDDRNAIYFGRNCAEKFFHINTNNLDTMDTALTNSIKEIVQLIDDIQDVNSYDGRTKIEDRIYKQSMFRDTVKKAIDNGTAQDIYEGNTPWLKGFLDNNLPIPDSLNSLLIITFTRKKKDLKTAVDDEAKKRDDTKDEGSDDANSGILRKRLLNTVSADDDEVETIDYTPYWGKIEPEYSEFVDYFPESKIYFNFMYKYRMTAFYGIDIFSTKFEKAHSGELKQIAWAVGAHDFTAEEMNNVILLLKLEKKLSDDFSKLLSDNNITVNYDFLEEVIREYTSIYYYDRSFRDARNASFTYLAAVLRPYLPKVNEYPETGRKMTRLYFSQKVRLLSEGPEPFNDAMLYPIDWNGKFVDKRKHMVSRTDYLADSKQALINTLNKLTANSQSYYLTMKDRILPRIITSLKKKAEEQDRLSKLQEIYDKQKQYSAFNITDEILNNLEVYNSHLKDGNGFRVIKIEGYSGGEYLRLYCKNNEIAELQASYYMPSRFRHIIYTGDVFGAIYDADANYSHATFKGHSEKTKPKFNISEDKDKNTLYIKDDNGSLDIEIIFDDDKKHVTVSYIHDTEVMYEYTYSLKTYQEIEEDRKKEEEAKYKEEKDKLENDDSYKLADYPEEIVQLLPIDDVSDFGKMILFIDAETEAGRYFPKPRVAGDIAHTLASALKENHATKCTPKQYHWLIIYVKQVQDAIRKKQEELEIKTTTDFMKECKDLWEKYGDDCMPDTFMRLMISKSKCSFNELTEGEQEMCYDLICRYFSKYNLLTINDTDDDETKELKKKYNMLYSIIPMEYRTRYYYLENGKNYAKLLERVYENKDALLSQNNRALERGFRVLESVMDRKYFSLKQKRYLDELIQASKAIDLVNKPDNDD